MAISRHVSGDLEPGATAFLSVDDDVLDEIAFNTCSADSGKEDFLDSIRAQLGLTLRDNRWHHATLKLPSERAVLEGGVPVCTAFLAFLVLCASKCGDPIQGAEGEPIQGLTTDNTFFPYVKLLLGGFPTQTREGLGGLDYRPGQSAPELSRWLSWERYLGSHGLVFPRANARGPRQNWGIALEQVVLTSADRRFLADLSPRSKDHVVNLLALAAKGRYEPADQWKAKGRLHELWSKRWKDDAVIETIRNALDGLPGCRSPIRLAFERWDQFGRVRYLVRAKLPPRWDGDAAAIGGQRSPFDLFSSLKSGYHVSVRSRSGSIRKATIQRPYYRFVEDETGLGPSTNERLPDLYEPHWMVVPVASMREFTDLAAAAVIAYDRPVFDDDWAGWVELPDFQLLRPLVETSLGNLAVRDRTRVWLEGGFTASNRRNENRYLLQKPGYVFADKEVEVVLDNRCTFELGPENPAPLPEDLKEGVHSLMFEGSELRFQLVDWQGVSGPLACPQEWLGK